jgi:hypothetical protein
VSDSGTPGASHSAKPRGHDRHGHAVRNTLRWADEAAAEGDVAAGLEWLATVEAVGEALPDEYRAKKAAWSAQVRP